MNNIIEFDDYLDNRLTGSEAISQRVKTRIKHSTSDIPYYSRGIDLAEFTFGSQLAAIKLGLRDLGPSVTYDDENKRIQVYDISVDASTISQE